MKLGKLPPRHDPRTLIFGDYFARRKHLPPSPPVRDWNDKLGPDLGMMKNDEAGDCGFAGLGHAIMTWSSEHGNLYTPSDTEVLGWYSECTGYVPGDPSTDNGVVLLDALTYFRKKGLIFAFMKVDHHSFDHLQTAINLFGGVYIGASLPVSAQDTSRPWHGTTGSLEGDAAVGSWGGHCMWAAKYARPAASAFNVDFSTWGKRQPADAQWWLDYVDECYAILSPRWADTALPAPSGFDLATLRADLSAL